MFGRKETLCCFIMINWKSTRLILIYIHCCCCCIYCTSFQSQETTISISKNNTLFFRIFVLPRSRSFFSLFLFYYLIHHLWHWFVQAFVYWKISEKSSSNFFIVDSILRRIKLFCFFFKCTKYLLFTSIFRIFFGLFEW